MHACISRSCANSATRNQDQRFTHLFGTRLEEGRVPIPYLQQVRLNGWPRSGCNLSARRQVALFWPMKGERGVASLTFATFHNNYQKTLFKFFLSTAYFGAPNLVLLEKNSQQWEF
jgi:hypothetical protein